MCLPQDRSFSRAGLAEGHGWACHDVWQEGLSFVCVCGGALTCTLWCCTSSPRGSRTCHRPLGNSWLSSACRRSASRSFRPSPLHSPLSQACACGRPTGWLGSGCPPPGCSGSGRDKAQKQRSYLPGLATERWRPAGPSGLRSCRAVGVGTGWRGGRQGPGAVREEGPSTPAASPTASKKPRQHSAAASICGFSK